MSEKSFVHLLGRKIWLGGLAFLVAASVLAALALTHGGSNNDPGTVDATVSSADDAQQSTDDTRPRAQLRADLKKARALEGQARIDAVKAIRAKVRDGAYGDRLEKRADHRSARRQAVLALLPDQLQKDLKALHEADRSDRKAMREDLRKKALDGTYGDKVQAAAEELKDFWKD